MRSEEELGKAIQKGRRFQALYDDPTFKELIDEIGSNAFHLWNTSEIKDKETQEIAKHDLEAGKRTLAFCKSHINAGFAAQKELEKLEKQVNKT